MIKRQIQAIAAGICIAVIVQESVWIGLDLLDPTRSLNQALAQAPLSRGWIVPLLVAWIVGGAFAGLMATLVGRNRIIGHAAGLLLSGSALVLAMFSMPQAGLFLVVAATPSLGAALGTWIGVALLDGETDQLVTPPVIIQSEAP